MRQFRFVMPMAALMVGAMFASAASGAVSYGYITGTVGSSGTSTLTTSYSTPVGTPITIPLYLQETVTGSSTSVINGDGGLNGVGFLVTQTTAGTGTITTLTGSINGNGSNFPGGLSNQKPGSNSTTSGFLESTSLSANSGPDTTITSGQSGQIEIGSVTIDPTTTGALTFKLANYNYPSTNAGGFTATFNTGYDLDGNSSSPAYTGTISSGLESFTVTATAVPEPASLSLLGIGCIALLVRRRRQA